MGLVYRSRIEQDNINMEEKNDGDHSVCIARTAPCLATDSNRQQPTHPSPGLSAREITQLRVFIYRLASDTQRHDAERSAHVLSQQNYSSANC